MKMPNMTKIFLGIFAATIFYPLNNFALAFPLFSDSPKKSKCQELIGDINKYENCLKQMPQQQQERVKQQRPQLMEEANYLYKTGNLTGAEEKYRRLIKSYPKDAYLRYQLGNVLSRQEKAEEAITAYQEAIRLNSKYALAHNAIGLVRANQGLLEEAITEFQKAVAINPNYAEALTNLGQALWQTGKKEEAIASLEKATNEFKKQQRNGDVQRIEQLLQQIKNSTNGLS